MSPLASFSLAFSNFSLLLRDAGSCLTRLPVGRWFSTRPLFFLSFTACTIASYVVRCHPLSSFFLCVVLSSVSIYSPSPSSSFFPWRVSHTDPCHLFLDPPLRAPRAPYIQSFLCSTPASSRIFRFPLFFLPPRIRNLARAQQTNSGSKNPRDAH